MTESAPVMVEQGADFRVVEWVTAATDESGEKLSIMGGTIWDFSPLGAGAPLANLMQWGWRNEGFIDSVGRFQSILGDPTLRLHRVSPVTYLTGSRVGSSATLNWNSSLDPGCGYYIYRSIAGLGGPWILLNSSPTTSLSFIDGSAVAGAMYQVKATRLQVTGSGSYWNLSQSAFINVP